MIGELVGEGLIAIGLHPEELANFCLNCFSGGRILNIELILNLCELGSINCRICQL